MRSLAIIAAAVLLSGATAPGLYNARETELVAGLELKPDGRFRFGLSYGALDEQAEGIWTERDGAVMLTTEPAVVPPRFALVSDAPVADGTIRVALDQPDALGDFSLTVAVTYADDPKIHYLEAGEDGMVPIEAGRTAATIIPDLPVYAIPHVPYRLTPGGHRLLFRFEATDIGKADFRDQPVTIEGEQLVLSRHDRTIRFRRGP